jgi:hypothetical protein
MSYHHSENEVILSLARKTFIYQHAKQLQLTNQYCWPRITDYKARKCPQTYHMHRGTAGELWMSKLVIESSAY